MLMPSRLSNACILGDPYRLCFSASSRIRSRSGLSSLGLPLYCLLDRFTFTSLHDFRSLSPKLSITYITAFLLALGVRSFFSADPPTLSCPNLSQLQASSADCSPSQAF